MGAIEDFSAYVARKGLFVGLRRLLVDRQFLAFTEKVRPMLDTADFPDRDLFLLLVHDALSMLGPDETNLEADAIERLADSYLPGYGAPPAKTVDQVAEQRPRLVEKPVAGGTIQLRRVVQVTTYGVGRFEDSDRAGIQRTVLPLAPRADVSSRCAVPLSRAVCAPDLPAGGRNEYRLAWAIVPRRVFAFALRSALDVLLVTPGEGDPVMGFELDSAYHDEPAARVRDQMKDELLQMIKIPLVRLRVDDSTSMTVDDWYAALPDQVGEIPMPKRHRSREQTLSFVPVDACQF
jgi:hypothetical protein